MAAWPALTAGEKNITARLNEQMGDAAGQSLIAGHIDAVLPVKDEAAYSPANPIPGRFCGVWWASQ
jgi:hypothetical protein